MSSKFLFNLCSSIYVSLPGNIAVTVQLNSKEIRYFSARLIGSETVIRRNSNAGPQSSGAWYINYEQMKNNDV